MKIVTGKSRPDSLPVIWGVSGFLLGGYLRHVAPEFAHRAHLDVIAEVTDVAVSIIRRRMRRERCDALISSGANASYLRRHFSIPVISVRMGGFDIMNALVEARRVANKIAVVLHGTVTESISEFASSFSLPIEFRYFNELDEVRDVIAALIRDGVTAVVGSGKAVHTAREMGIPGFFIYTPEAVRLALEDALDLVNARLAERSRHTLLTTVLHHLSDGVIAVDLAGRLMAANPAAENLTKRRLAGTLGKDLKNLLPDFGPDREEQEKEAVKTIDGRVLVVTSSALFEGGQRIGSVLTLHSPRSVETAFSKLRAHNHARSRAARHTLENIVAESPQMRTVVNRCAVFARHSDAAIMLTGPSGSGKELLAQGIHNAGQRRQFPFVAVNCGAFPETLLESELFGYVEGAFTGAMRSGKPGLFEAADKGTVFFDEVAELPLHLQTRLLRVLQEREIVRLGGHQAVPVDVRIIAATHRNLLDLVRKGAFREDLYYRMNALSIHVPPLCERPKDIDILAENLFGAALARAGLPDLLPDVLKATRAHLHRHTWPGNVRELENMAERVAMVCLEMGRAVAEKDVAGLLEIPQPPEGPGRSVPDLPRLRRLREREYILSVLDQCNGRRELAAGRLGVSRTTLWRKLREE